jgi:aromatic-L-amino-acid decarboxylase
MTENSKPQTEFRVDSLDSPLPEFQRDLEHCARLIIERYRNMFDANAHAGVAEQTVYNWFDEGLPEKPTVVTKLLNDIEATVVAHPTMNIGTKMFAYVMSGGTQVSVLADMLASALNQNGAKWHLAPAMTEIERRVISWTCDFIGLDEPRGGAIVSGGSEANLTGLTVARNVFCEGAGVRQHGLFGMPPLVTYTSTQVHASVDKSIELLGLGSDNLRKLPTHNDFTVDVGALRAQITRDRQDGYTPFCIVGNAGTVNTGAIDPLADLAAVARAENMWFHVDGAYGGLAASLPAARQRYRGLEFADSIALDYHKWLYQPFEVGCTLVRDWQALERTYHHSAEYLDYGANPARFDISKHHFALSRNAKAFKVWMSFKAYGAERLRNMISKDLACAEYLAETIRTSDDFELISSAPFAIVCFRYRDNNTLNDAQLDALNAELVAALERDGRVFITGTRLHGRQVLRACIINHRIAKQDIDFLLDTIREVAVARVTS